MCRESRPETVIIRNNAWQQTDRGVPEVDFLHTDQISNAGILSMLVYTMQEGEEVVVVVTAEVDVHLLGVEMRACRGGQPGTTGPCCF